MKRELHSGSDFKTFSYPGSSYPLFEAVFLFSTNSPEDGTYRLPRPSGKESLNCLATTPSTLLALLGDLPKTLGTGRPWLSGTAFSPLTALAESRHLIDVGFFVLP